MLLFLMTCPYMYFTFFCSATIPLDTFPGILGQGGPVIPYTESDYAYLTHWT